MNKSSFGLIGLGVMGRNLLLNVADHGFQVSGLDLDPKQVSAMKSERLEDHQLEAYTSTDDFLDSLTSPRTIMLLVPAGAIVDQVIESLIPKLDKGDLIIDGGNSHFLDTERREQYLNSKGLLFLERGYLAVLKELERDRVSCLEVILRPTKGWLPFSRQSQQNTRENPAFHMSDDQVQVTM